MKRKNTLSILAGVVVSMAFMSAALAQQGRPQQGGGQPGFGGGFQGQPGGMPPMQGQQMRMRVSFLQAGMESFAPALGLSEEQQSAIRKIRKDTREAIRKIAQGGPVDQETAEEIQQIEKDAEAKILASFGSQKSRAEALMADMKLLEQVRLPYQLAADLKLTGDQREKLKELAKTMRQNQGQQGPGGPPQGGFGQGGPGQGGPQGGNRPGQPGQGGPQGQRQGGQQRGQGFGGPQGGPPQGGPRNGGPGQFQPGAGQPGMGQPMGESPAMKVLNDAQRLIVEDYTATHQQGRMMGQGMGMGMPGGPGFGPAGGQGGPQGPGGGPTRPDGPEQEA